MIGTVWSSWFSMHSELLQDLPCKDESSLVHFQNASLRVVFAIHPRVAGPSLSPPCSQHIQHSGLENGGAQQAQLHYSSWVFRFFQVIPLMLYSCYTLHTHAVYIVEPLQKQAASPVLGAMRQWAKAWPLKQVSSIAPIPATVTRQNMIIKKLDWETLAIFAINLITLIIIILNHLLSEHLSNPKQISPIAEIKFRGCALGTNATGANARVALALASLEFLQHCNTTLESETLRQPNVLLEDMARHDAKALGLASGPKVAAKFAKWNLRRGSANWVMSWLGTLLSCIFVRDKKGRHRPSKELSWKSIGVIN